MFKWLRKPKEDEYFVRCEGFSVLYGLVGAAASSVHQPSVVGFPTQPQSSGSKDLEICTIWPLTEKVCLLLT